MPLPLPPAKPTETSTGYWQDRAACKEVDDITVFIPDEPITSRTVWDKARSFCNRCEVRQECLELALRAEEETRYRYGMFGGMTPRERGDYAWKIKRR